MPNSLKERSYWLLGASHGIGRALAKELHKEGAKLIISGRDLRALQTLQQETGANVEVCPLDISNAETFATTVKSLAEKKQLPDSVIYLAGFYEPCSIAETTEENIQRSLEINFIGCYRAVQALLPYFSAREFGQIAICGSVSGYRGLPNGQPYSASKAALINFTESLRCEWQSKGLDIRLISPGFVKTRLTDKNRFDMPDIITPEQAAQSIVAGLKTQQYEIHFPKKFTWKLKLLQLLPDRLYFYLMDRLKR